MSLRSTCTRLAIVAAAGTLLVSTAAPALADGRDDEDDSYSHSRHDNWDDRDDDGRDNPRRYRGVVTAEELLLRSRPDRGSRVIRVAHRGERVWIDCKTPGQRVDGNPLWYLLTDGTWAWGSARFIDNIGPAPRWC
ncbi:SH3 domain-containing protein [Streptomyces sp. NPDC091279]|uniref:SH3 domain-containing protein n=1 Tax=unclassified Streptomyces TaxID=2593676 RepID=UPI00381843FC